MGTTKLVLFKEERISMGPSNFIICSKTEFAIKHDELIEVYIILSLNQDGGKSYYIENDNIVWLAS